MANPTLLDFEQAVQLVTDDTAKAFQVKNIGGSLVNGTYDYILITYVPSGNGAGEIQTVTFKNGGSGGTTVATLTLVYDSSNKLSTVTKS